MGRSSSPRRYGSGSQQSVPRPPTSCRAVHGKTAIARALTRNSVTNCSTAKSSTRSRRRRSSSKTGDSITTQCGPIHRWATSHQHHKQPSGPHKMGQRQRQQWQVDPACTNSKHGSPHGGRPNLINRDFQAKARNEKWLTDITEFHIPAGKVYLSPIIDCFDV